MSNSTARFRIILEPININKGPFGQVKETDPRGDSNT